MRSVAASPPAIVLGIEHPRGLAVVRSLGRMGIHVVGVDHHPWARGFYSRYLREKVRVAGQPDEVLTALERYAGGVLIATNDLYIELVARNAERLSERFIVTTPPWHVTGRLMDKERCYELARSINIDTPRTFSPKSVADLDCVLEGLDFKGNGYVITKQLPVGIATDAMTNRYTRVGGGDATTLRARCLETLERSGELPLIAEIVPGEASSCLGMSMVVDRNGDSVAWHGVKRLQLRAYSVDQGFVHPYELGANVYCESTHDDEALDATLRLLRAAEYYGAATVEFRRDLRDGKLKLIKVDPRFVRATSLSTALGVDLPRALYLTFTGGHSPAPRAYAAGVAWVWLSAMGARHAGAALRNLRGVRAEAYWSADDPVPGLVELLGWGKKTAGGILGRAPSAYSAVPPAAASR